jgi:hypothetical protein
MNVIGQREDQAQAGNSESYSAKVTAKKLIKIFGL